MKCIVVNDRKTNRFLKKMQALSARREECNLCFYTISHSKRPFSRGKWAVMSENGLSINKSGSIQ
jgi:hypothetical protein